MRRALAPFLPLLIAACTAQPPPPRPVETDVPTNLEQAAPVRPQGASIGTPMAKRVAVIGLLNKRNDLSQDLEMKPGETRRVGDVIVRLAACERTAPWESPKQTGAFVQVFVHDAGAKVAWRKIFSGWMFKESPSLNVVEHPIYDVWVKDCRMTFAGAEPVASTSPSSAAKASGKATAPAAAPTPQASASNAQ
jgi:hypothetical protein